MNKPGRFPWPAADTKIYLRKALLAIVFIVYFAFFLPFWKPIAAGIIFACGCSPLVTAMKNKLHMKRTLSSYLFLGFMTVFLSVALILFFTSMYSFVTDLARNNREFLTADISSILAKIQTSVTSRLGEEYSGIANDGFETLRGAASNVGGYVTTFAQQLLQNIPDFLLDFFIFFLIFFGFILFRTKIWGFVCDLLGIEGHELGYISRFETMCARTLASIFVIGFIQSIIVTIGIWGTHASTAVFFLFNLTFLFSLIPLLGAAVIPTILSITNFIDGNATAGIILLVIAGIAGSIDNILKGVMFSKASNSNAILSLIALLGSLILFGFVGLFISPVFEQIIMAYLEKRSPSVVAENK